MRTYIKTNESKRLDSRSYRAALLVALVVAGCLLADPGAPAASETESATRMIRDKAGRLVRIPKTPKRIACLHGPSYEKLFAFGAADRVAVIPNTQRPWCYRLNPGLKDVPVLGNYASPDVERLMSLGTDLVIYFPFAKQIQRLNAAGLPVVVAYDGSKRQTNMADFIQDWYGQIRFYGELLGKKAETVAEAYCTYVDQRLQKVVSVTSKIPEADRPRVFYFCGQANGPLGTQTRFATAYWLVAAAGGAMLTHDESAYFVSVSTEQLIRWNPEIIVVSTPPSTDPIMKNPQLKEIDAVKNGRVFLTPEGLFYWSHFSTESFLCVLVLAKHFHPDLFADLDVKQELKNYYEKFYHYKLTDGEARRILAHMPPEEMR